MSERRSSAFQSKGSDFPVEHGIFHFSCERRTRGLSKHFYPKIFVCNPVKLTAKKLFVFCELIDSLLELIEAKRHDFLYRKNGKQNKKIKNDFLN